MRALLFLDVDGPLIPFRHRALSPPDRGNPLVERLNRADGPLIPFRHRALSPPDQGNPLVERLNPADGPRLLSLGCDLVWATTWMADANEAVAPRLGLPALPLVDWPDDEAAIPRLHWKTVTLTEWAAGRPFIWLDDEIADPDREWVAAHHAGRALLHRVDPHVGLTEDDFAALRSWLADP